MKIGDSIWRFDLNRCVYRKDAQGRSIGGPPIYREHWTPIEITGETSRSWVVGKGYAERKIPKKGEHRGYAFDELERDEDCYVHENRHRIVREIERINDVATLRLVAEAIGYEAAK